MSASFTIEDRTAPRDRTWILAIVFGLASVPWTYAFVVTDVPLWPSFVAAATFYAAGGGLDGFLRGSVGNVVGVLYGAATLTILGVLGGSSVALAILVGAFMFLASLHAFVPSLSFTPAGFFGYATLFGVHASGATVFLDGLAGETIAAVGAMLVGVLIGFATEWTCERLTPGRGVER